MIKTKNYIISIVLLIISSFFSYCIADDNSSKRDQYNYYAKLEIEKIFKNNPKIFKSAFECYRHTYIWYKWQEYDKADYIGKLVILKEIINILK